MGAQAVSKTPEGYVITSLNERHQPVRGGVLIKGENYWPVKLKHRSTGHTKWVNLRSDEPTVQAFAKETWKMQQSQIDEKTIALKRVMWTTICLIKMKR